MKQIYYVIQTLLRGRGSNIIKILSLGLALTMSILLFVRVAFEQSYDTCYRDPDRIYQLFSIFTINGERGEPGELNLPPCGRCRLGELSPRSGSCCQCLQIHGFWTAL